MTTPAGPAMTAPAGRNGSEGLAKRGGVVFFHAHPDDEAIFTGGTMAMLARSGCPVTLVVATSGELGQRRQASCDEVGPLRERNPRRVRAARG